MGEFWLGIPRIVAYQYNATMEIISVQSGSNGNCIYVETGDIRLLFDAGISGVQVRKRLADHGRDVEDVNAVVVSHDHVDHSRCMGFSMSSSDR